MKFNLDNLVLEYEELERKMSDPDNFKDQKKMRELSSRKKSIDEAVNIYREYKLLYEALEENKAMLYTEKDEEMRDMIKEEIYNAENSFPILEEKLKISLLPKDPNDDRNIIVEVRAGAGGDEASLFASELSKAYILFAESEGFSVDVSDQSENETGGVKEIMFEIKGAGAYSRFKYESGVHRVQRIPETESKGRVHTSTITVAIMPEVDEVDIDLKDEDVTMTFTRSSGAGGQHVNKTDSAVQLKHIPTGIMVFCQDGRSQHKNREKARNILRSKLFTFEEEKRQKELGDARLAQVGSGDRSEKIRTYNFPQDRVTDHRIGQNFSGLPQIMMGKLGAIIDACAVADQQAKLEAAGKGNV
ncbi:MAG: peptide chain release factor 1 [Candidatus Gracilibacteria bacterium]|nr:peptide chain release factor 1 [Candidatus Gracilibacteria bacterium]